MKFKSKVSKAEYLTSYDSFERSWPVEFESRRIDTLPYGITYVRICGKEESPPLVLLPAAHSNSLVWARCIETLAMNYRVYAIDPIYGHGKSVSDGKVSTVEELVDWIDLLLGGLGLVDKINLCGMSLGGWISAKYTLHRPNRISRLALIAPAATVLPIRKEFLIRGIMAASIPMKWPTLSFEKWLLTINGKSPSNLENENNVFITLMYHSAKAYKLPRHYPIPTMLNNKELESLGNVRTLFLIGNCDQMYSVKKARARLEALAPSVEKYFVENAGHAILRSHSQEIVSRLKEFLSS